MQKKEWVQHIESFLRRGKPFIYKCVQENKAHILFACDYFRRRRHDVKISLEPTPEKNAVLNICIMPARNYLEFTIRRDQTSESIIESIVNDNAAVVSVRGCGIVVNNVCKVVEWAIHNGWYVDNTVLNTLTQISSDNIKQRNTTMMVTLRRGSNTESI